MYATFAILWIRSQTVRLDHYDTELDVCVRGPFRSCLKLGNSNQNTFAPLLQHLHEAPSDNERQLQYTQRPCTQTQLWVFVCFEYTSSSVHAISTTQASLLPHLFLTLITKAAPQLSPGFHHRTYEVEDGRPAWGSPWPPWM
jgi:hypothetical protein